jgi:hypothetical protein
MQEGILAVRGTRVICPGCGTRFAITPEYYGRSFPCEKCKEDLLVPEYKGRTDARPILRRGENVVWKKIEDERDRIYEALLKVCEKFELDAHVLRSSPYAYPAMVTLECWVPKDNSLVTERSSAAITIQPKPFHRHEVLFDVQIQKCQGLGKGATASWSPLKWWFILLCIVFTPLLLAMLGYYAYRFLVSRGGKFKRFSGLRELPAESLEGLVGFLLNKGWCPYLRKFAVRKHWWQLWRPRNKIETLMPDWLAILNVALVVLGIGIFGYCGGNTKHAKYQPAAYVLWTASVGLFIYLKLRPRLVRSSGKPNHEPRSLLAGDGWHVVLFEAGQDAGGLKDEFAKLLKAGAHEKLRSWTEKIWYEGLDDIEEREQIVVSFGRAMVYCQIYRYQDDLYVGWDAYLNEAQWEETSMATGLDRECGLPVTVAVAVSGEQEPSEYDVADLHLVTEWVHARLSNLVRRVIKDKGIDQEIDFKPVRSVREAREAVSEPASGGLFGRLFRRKS